MPRFFSSLALLLETLNNLAFSDCPYCRKMGNLRKHSNYFRVSRNGNGLICHGKRCFCSNRYKNKGCGSTFILQLTEKLPGLNHFTSNINDFLLHYSESENAIESWKEHIPYFQCITEPYRFLAHLKKALPKLKGALNPIKKPPDGLFKNSILQIIEHFKTIFNEESMLQELIVLLNSRPF